jgi:hypothetical protein
MKTFVNTHQHSCCQLEKNNVYKALTDLICIHFASNLIWQRLDNRKTIKTLSQIRSRSLEIVIRDLIKAVNINHRRRAHPSEISLSRHLKQLGRAGILSGLSGLEGGVFVYVHRNAEAERETAAASVGIILSLAALPFAVAPASHAD